MAFKDIVKQIGVTVAVAIVTPIVLQHAEKGVDLAKKGVQKVKVKVEELRGKKP